MRIIAAYLLAVLGGNSSPTTEDIKNILDSVGVATDTDRADKLVAELEGKNVWEVVAAGKSKLSSVPSTAAPAAASSGSSSAPPSVNEVLLQALLSGQPEPRLLEWLAKQQNIITQHHASHPLQQPPSHEQFALRPSPSAVDAPRLSLRQRTTQPPTAPSVSTMDPNLIQQLFLNSMSSAQQSQPASSAIQEEMLLQLQQQGLQLSVPFDFTATEDIIQSIQASNASFSGTFAENTQQNAPPANSTFNATPPMMEFAAPQLPFELQVLNTAALGVTSTTPPTSSPNSPPLLDSLSGNASDGKSSYIAMLEGTTFDDVTDLESLHSFLEGYS
jgi:large subunit ribosomal protein LP2